MDTFSAFARGEIARRENATVKTFDWNKAAQIIKERKPQTADAGLAGDYAYTRGQIYADGAIVSDDYTYLSSNWATPMLIIDREEIACFCEEAGSGWNSGTKWPESARKILADG